MVGRALRALLAVVAVALMALPASDASAHTGPRSPDAALTAHDGTVVGNSQLESTVDPAVLRSGSDSGNRHDVRTRMTAFVTPETAGVASTGSWWIRIVDRTVTPARHGADRAADARGPPARDG